MVNFSEKCIFILGAGVSADADISTSSKLNEEVRNWLKSEYPDTNCDQRKLYNFLIGTIYYYRGLNNIYPIEEEINIEQLLNTLKILRRREQELLSAFVGNWHEKLGYFSQEFLSEFEKKLLQFVVDKLTVKQVAKTQYLKWFGDLHKQQSSTIHIFTLNQDRTIETALEAESYPYVDGFDPKELVWNPEVFEENNPINLYKIHGSLGWQIHKDTGEIICNKSLGVSDRHLMIFGVMEKLTIEEPFFELIKLLKDRAKKADLLVIIGYSFQDEYINKIIFDSLRVEKEKKMLVVDKEISVIQDRLRTKHGSAFNISSVVYCPASDGVKQLFESPGLAEKIDEILKEVETSPF